MMKKLFIKQAIIAAAILSFIASPLAAETPATAIAPMGTDKNAGYIDFSKAPKRKNTQYPLSDQKNKGGWVKIEEDCDEFNDMELNTDKWWPNNPTWKGRQPTYFHGSNVSMDGEHVVFKVNQHGDEQLPDGYTDTAGFIVGRKAYTYGYFEARLKLNKSPWIAGFWLQIGAVKPDWDNISGAIGNEIDICENAPGCPGHEYRLNSNVHIHMWDPKTKTKMYGPKFSKAHIVPFKLHEDFHTWGLEWTKDYIRFYLDGVMWREIENIAWHYPQEVKINNESNAWFGAIPNGTGEDEVYLVDYFRVWQQKE